MAEFISFEESALTLGVGESELLEWIHQGRVRAIRRAGQYILRHSELQRLESELASTLEGNPESNRPKVLPPRSAQNPQTFAGDRERRRHSGRRSGDLTVEVLRHEIQRALEPLFEKVAQPPPPDPRPRALEEAEVLLELQQVQLQQLQTEAAGVEAERARHQLDLKTLQGEIDRLESLNRQRASEEQELRRLREQVTQLSYRLQMAQVAETGQTQRDEARVLLEKLSEAQGEILEKNNLITQNYAELSELRSKLDASQRNYYELQHRYEKLEQEWSQLAAQWACQMNEQQQHQQIPPTSPDRSKGGWNLFGRREG